MGRFFQSNSVTNRREALIMLVTVHLQDPSGRPINPR